MPKLPKARTVGFSLLFLLAVLLQGCSCRERYAPFLQHVETSLRDHVAPKLRESLEKNGRDPKLIDNDVGEVEDLADACERIRTQGTDAWKPGSQEGGGR